MTEENPALEDPALLSLSLGLHPQPFDSCPKGTFERPQSLSW